MNEPDGMKNFKLIIEYDGTGFNGWQVQAAGRTVQGEIEKAVSTMTGRNIRISGSGRTDAGVHALGQVAAFRCSTRLNAEVFYSGLNSLLPDDIAVLSCEQVAPDFHPRFDASAKTYLYRINNTPMPAAVGRGYFWHIKNPLDIDAMRAAIRHVIGTHDFRAFENTGSPRSHTVRTVYSAAVQKAPDPEDPLAGHDKSVLTGRGLVAIHITANGFLRCMVRNIAGSLVEVGLLRLTPDEFAVIMEKKDRRLAPPAAPPHGLFLHSVQYGKAG